MARRRASTPSTAAAAPRGASVNDRTLYTHNLWLNYLKPVSLGLVFSPSALRAAQVELPLQSAEAQRALEALSVSRPETDDEETEHENPARILRSTREFLTEFLGWQPELLDFFRPSARAQMFAGQGIANDSQPADDRPEPPDSLRHELAQYDDTLEPSFAYRWPQPPEVGSRWCLLGLDVPPEVDLDRKPPEADEVTWVESPQKKFERLLYETGIPLGCDRPGDGRAAGLPARGAAVGVHHVPARSAAEAGRSTGVLCAQGRAQSRSNAPAARAASGCTTSWPRVASIRTRSRRSSPSRCWRPCSNC